MRVMRILSCCVLIAFLAAPCASAQDRAGALGQINTDLSKADGWQRIVENSGFSLGEKTEWTDGFYRLDYGSYPLIDGSTVSLPMVMEFAWQHQVVRDEDVPGFVFLTTTHNAYVNLIMQMGNNAPYVAGEMAMMDPEHPVDLFIGTEPSQEEQEMAAAQNIALTIEPVCLDAFVFIVNKANPVNGLTSEHIRAIYRGDITSWSEVGGANEAIFPFRRNQNSGSETGMQHTVMRGEPMPAAQENYIAGEMEMLVTRVSDNPYSLGYTYMYYLNNLYLDENIKIISVDGITPDNLSIQTGAYPFTTRYVGVIRSQDSQKPGGLFLNWIISPEGQACVAQAGYIPVSP
ncbi:MAG: substrate-binding domain-containing protein [Clostridia bacterium]|nr:substrate-binding domain-containing protein [Clostridia bacterium]